MGGLVYSGKFEKLMNELSSPNNVAATAKKFNELEKQHGPYSFGKFVKLTTPQANDYENWENVSPTSSPPISDRHRRCR